METLFQKIPELVEGGGLSCVVKGLGNACVDDPFQPWSKVLKIIFASLVFRYMVSQTRNHS